MFRLYPHITYFSYFVSFYLFLLWHSSSLWRCFVLLLSYNRKLVIFHWSLSVSKSPQISRCLLTILADFNNFNTLFILDYSFDIPFFLNFQQTIGDRSQHFKHSLYRFHFHVPLPFSSLVTSRYLSIFFVFFFYFSLCFSARTPTRTRRQFLFSS